MAEEGHAFITRLIPAAGPVGSILLPVWWNAGPNQSVHHSQAFPVMEYRPKPFGGNASTGQVPANPSSAVSSLGNSPCQMLHMCAPFGLSLSPMDKAFAQVLLVPHIPTRLRWKPLTGPLAKLLRIRPRDMHDWMFPPLSHIGTWPFRHGPMRSIHLAPRSERPLHSRFPSRTFLREELSSRLESLSRVRVLWSKPHLPGEPSSTSPGSKQQLLIVPRCRSAIRIILSQI